MTYEEALAYISGLQTRGWKLGLERMELFVDRAGLRDSVGAPGGPQYIHIAGTNGKGSVTAFVQSMLVEAGHRTGAFFSPFVADPRERIQYGRELIGKQELADLTARLGPVGESLGDTEYGGISEFELKTGLGFAYWKERRCEWVALEVGLGGRLDSTNVVTPRASVIVSIGMDHMHILGDTEAKIALEKAGIVKSDVPAIIGRMSEEARDVILQVAAERGAPVWLMDREILYEVSGDPVWPEVTVRTPAGEATVRPSLYGPIQAHNVALAVAAMQASGACSDPAALARGAANASIPGRFQRLKRNGREWILDGAHNLDAGRIFGHALRTYLAGRPAVLLTGMVTGHDARAFYEALGGGFAHTVCAPIDFHRALPPAEVAEALPWKESVEVSATLSEAIAKAEATAGGDAAIVVTGSFYLVGEVLNAVGA